MSERSVERNENTSVTSGGSDSNAISPECNPGAFDGGDSSRFNQSQRSSRHATTKTATTTRSTRTCDARRQLEIQPRSAERTSNRGERSVERNENTSISSRG